MADLAAVVTIGTREPVLALIMLVIAAISLALAAGVLSGRRVVRATAMCTGTLLALLSCYAASGNYTSILEGYSQPTVDIVLFIVLSAAAGLSTLTAVILLALPAAGRFFRRPRQTSTSPAGDAGNATHTPRSEASPWEPNNARQREEAS